MAKRPTGRHDRVMVRAVLWTVGFSLPAGSFIGPASTIMWLFCVELGFAGFILCLFGLVWRGFGRDGLARPAAKFWFLAAVLCFAFMCLALPRVPRPDKAVEAEVALAKARK
ncbi:MAG: hypothetical protein JO316_17500 [Abitibacteriaceae bacterium]|nr:hypothetical protein [Abditibacteriaceae bacterium]MBV9867154.1 hypothetical protein [Abditibacteriaceae bacterium]